MQARIAVYLLTLHLGIAPVLGTARSHDMDIFFSSHTWSALTSRGNGTTASFQGKTLGGLGIGLPVHRRWTINTEVLAAEPTVAVTPGVSSRADVLALMLGADYVVREVSVPAGSLAPYVTGGLGSTHFKQDHAAGIDEWPLSYNLGVGLRWNLPASVFLKFQYRWVWTNLKVTGRTELFDGPGFAVGFAF